MFLDMLIGETPNDTWTLNFGEINHKTDVAIPKHFALELLKIKEEMKALKITKSEYDEAMKFCVENLTDHKFGSVKDCLASVVEEMKGLRKVVEAAKFVPRNIVSTDPISIRVVANLKEALEDYDKNRGAV